MSVKVRSMRQSPFQETEWDMRLDTMLQDLQSGAQQQQQQQQHQSRYQQQQQQIFHHQQQHQQQTVSYSGSRHQLHHVEHQQQQQRQEQQVHQQQQSYPLAKSQSEGSLHESTGAMLKDLDNALRASSNYIETHRTVRGPEGTREFHEVRSFSSGGDQRGPDSGDYNLERQVQHMIPLSAPSPSLDRHYSSLQSANMVSSVQQQKSYTTYKVQSNQYSNSGGKMVPVDYSDGERPGSRLKQNIDELDTLLLDLNNVRGPANGDTRHQPTDQHPYGASSDDYSLSDSGQQGHVKRTVSSFNEYNYQTSSTGTAQPSGGDYYTRKPPSPSPSGRRRTAGSPGPVVQPPRRTSPGPSSSIAAASSSSYNYNLHQSTATNGHGPDYRSPGPDYGSSGPTYRSPSPYGGPSDNLRRSSPSPSGPRSPSTDGTPTGVSYYSKYHSTHTHQSQKSGGSSGPMAFPTSAVPPHLGSHTIQSPPKRVDELMSELADFDPSIQPSDIAEPTPSHRSRSRHTETVVTDQRHGDDHDYPRAQRRSPSPIRPTKQASTPGPPVYYPPGEVFGSTKTQAGSQQARPAPTPAPAALTAEQSTADGAKDRAHMRKEYGYKDKGRGGESDSKGGAAVVPICLPLCCAAPCVIL